MAPRVSHNVAASFFGKGWSAIIAIAFVPIYIDFLGIEAYGLIGLFTTLLVVSSSFDFGLSTALARELARLSSNSQNADQTRSLTYTFQALSWALALGLLVALVLTGLLFGGKWISSQELDERTLRDSLLLMGMAVAFQFPSTLYSNGILGLQRQIPLNALIASMATVRAVGAWFVLSWVAPTIQAFLLWQVFVSLLQSYLSGVMLWKMLPDSNVRLQFQLPSVLRIWKFALGMSLINIFAIALTQVDKLVLSTLLPLNEFGYYVLASTVAFGLLMLSAPFFSGLFPRFSQLLMEGDEVGISRLYHSASQVLAVIALPPCIIVAFFSHDLLMVWVRDVEIADRAHSLVTLLVLGTALNSMMYIPYALQIAHGWTRLSAVQNFLSVLILVPLLYVAVGRYGVEGAASVWILVNVGYLCLTIPIMHTKLLRGEQWRWYWYAVALPFLSAALPISLFVAIFSAPDGPTITFPGIIGILLISWAAAAFATPGTRRALRTQLTKYLPT